MITDRELTELKQLDLRKIAKHLPLSLSGEGGSDIKAACPKCGGTDRLVIRVNGFFCRQGPGHCGVKGDGVALVRLVNGLSFADSCAFLRDLADMPERAHERPQAEAKEAQDWRDEAWQKQASRSVKLAEKHMFTVPEVDYLYNRGFIAETLIAYGLGYTGRAYYDKDNPEAQAIVIPWRYEGQLTAVKWRFVQPPGNKRYGLAKYPPNRNGSTGSEILFMAPAERQSNTLVVTEGEFNSMSVYQASPYVPVSCGTQSFGPATVAALAGLAPQYDRLLIWTDTPETAQQIQTVLNHPAATLFQSPQVNGQKMDANTLLQAGVLGDLLRKLMGDEAPSLVAPAPTQPSVECVESLTGDDDESKDVVTPLLIKALPAQKGFTRSTNSLCTDRWCRPVIDIPAMQQTLETYLRSKDSEKRRAVKQIIDWLEGADLGPGGFTSAAYTLGGPIQFSVNWNDPRAYGLGA